MNNPMVQNFIQELNLHVRWSRRLNVLQTCSLVVLCWALISQFGPIAGTALAVANVAWLSKIFCEYYVTHYCRAIVHHCGSPEQNTQAQQHASGRKMGFVRNVVVWVHTIVVLLCTASIFGVSAVLWGMLFVCLLALIASGYISHHHRENLLKLQYESLKNIANAQIVQS